MRRLWLVSTILLAAGVSGCASLPNNHIVTYYLPKTEGAIRVTRTLSCSAQYGASHSETAVLTASHVADLDERQQIDLNSFDHRFAGSSFSVQLRANRTLQSINSSAEGGGSKVVTAVIPLAGRVLGIGGIGKDDETQNDETDCSPITELPNKNGVATLIYSGPVDFGNTETRQEIRFPLGNEQLRADLSALDVHPLWVMVEHQDFDDPPFPRADKREFASNLHLLQPGMATVKIVTGPNLTETIPVEDTAEVVWEDSFTASQAGATYNVPLPTTGGFGKSEFEIALRDDGSLQKLRYGLTNGIVSAVGSADETIDLVDGSTEAQELAAIQREIELIKARRDLEACRRDVSECAD